MRIVLVLAIAAVITSACGRDKQSDDEDGESSGKSSGESGTTDTTQKIKDLEKQMAALLGTQEQLQSLVMSDFASCQATGESADPLINKICKVSQAANVETRLLLKSELALASGALQDKVTALSDNLARLQDATASAQVAFEQQLAQLNEKITDLTDDLVALEKRMTDAEAAITALQNLTASIQGVLKGSLQEVEIGSENIAAGPLYESVLRRADKTRIVAYIDVFGRSQSLPNNPVQTVKGSEEVVIAAAAHGLKAGDIVKISNLREGAGYTSGDLVGEFQISQIPDGDHFMIRLRRKALSSTTFGGTEAVAQKIEGRGMGAIWFSAQGADRDVRATTLGSKRYSFLIKANGDVCYSRSNAAATFTEIMSGSADSICK